MRLNCQPIRIRDHRTQFQGLAYAANFGAIGTLCVRWAPLTEVSIFISVLTSFTPVSAVVTNPLSGWVSRHDYNYGFLQKLVNFSCATQAADGHRRSIVTQLSDW